LHRLSESAQFRFAPLATGPLLVLCAVVLVPGIGALLPLDWPQITMNTEPKLPNGSAETNRRKSGRVVRKPDLFSEDHYHSSFLSNGSAKRKRISSAGAPAEMDEDEEEQTSSDESDDVDTEDDPPDEEELREERRTQRKRASGVKPAVKRAKIAHGAGTTLAIRSGKTQSRPLAKGAKTKRARARPSQAQQEGLYADVFGKGNSAEDAASLWLRSLRKDSVAAIRDLVNFILQCVGCDVKVESPDVEDIDNVPNKLGDVLEEYGRTKSAEYPLISKQKPYVGFREVLVDFFKAIIKALHASSIFYEQPEVYDNIHIWVATMSGAGYRPFRHTATVISLSMTTALCEIAQEVQSSIAITRTQLETERKKKSVNKGRVNTMQQSMKTEEKKLETIDAQLRDAFDTVYVHRYRDVDEKIRVECVTALGNWIVLYRQMFLEGQYLRYLGWVLSDPSSHTRLEVLRQLRTLFKSQRNVAALRAFTDRFRPRIVEMGARDADIGVRVEAIELLDRLRNAELLEPDDIDTIGRLIFDTEPRVRKAVAKFFVSNIDDLYKASLEDLDAEQYEAILPSPDHNDDFMHPTQSWIKFKCLAQTLGSYDKDSESVEGGEAGQPVLRTVETESRYMLATQSIFHHMSELQQWESLAGYLLYDHSSIASVDGGNDTDVSHAVQAAFKLGPGEETILLDVLYYSVKLHLQSILESQTEKKGRKGHATKRELGKKQETTAHNLTLIIPQLLSKFGTTPQAAASILRLEQLLDIDLVNSLQSGEGTYSAILEDINRQFITHSDRKVLAEASKALRAARTYEQSKEATDAKVHEMWAECRSTLLHLLQGKNVESRGTLERNLLGEAVNTATRLANLASVSDCTEMLESRVSATTSKRQKSKAAKGHTLLELLLQLVKRGVPDEETTPHFAELEDHLCMAVITILSFYFRWQVVRLRSAIAANDSKELTAGTLVNLATRKSEFVEALLPIVQTRLPLDPVRVAALLTLLELFTLFATVRHMKPIKGILDEDVRINLASLATDVPSDVVKEVMVTHEKMEKSFAKKTHRKVDIRDQKKPPGTGIENDEDIEKPPEDSDDEAKDSDAADGGAADDEKEDEEDEEMVVPGGRNARKEAALLAEQALCELTSKIVLAIIAGLMDEEVKKRLQVNRTRLGKNYAQVIAYLDEKKKGMKGKRDTTAPVAGSEGGKKREVEKNAAPEAEPMVIAEDDIEDDDAGEEQDLDEKEVEEGEGEAGDSPAAGDGDGNDGVHDDEIMGD